MADEVAVGLTTLGLIDEMECQLTGGHNAGRSITRKLAITAVAEIKRLRGIEERAKTMLAAYRAEGGYGDQIGVLADILEGEGKVSEPDACHEEDPNADACRAFVMDYEGNAECVRCGAKIGKHPNAERRNDFN